MTEHRIRKSGMHRGWKPSQMQPDVLAKDIAESIKKSNGTRTVTQYTTDAVLIAKVAQLLAQ